VTSFRTLIYCLTILETSKFPSLDTCKNLNDLLGFHKRKKELILSLLRYDPLTESDINLLISFWEEEFTFHKETKFKKVPKLDLEPLNIYFRNLVENGRCE
jgi:hypothetical protein